MIKLILDVHGQKSLADPDRFLDDVPTEDLDQARLQHLYVDSATALDTYRHLLGYRWLSEAC